MSEPRFQVYASERWTKVRAGKCMALCGTPAVDCDLAALFDGGPVYRQLAWIAWLAWVHGDVSTSPPQSIGAILLPTGFIAVFGSIRALAAVAGIPEQSAADDLRRASLWRVENQPVLRLVDSGGVLCVLSFYWTPALRFGVEP